MSIFIDKFIESGDLRNSVSLFDETAELKLDQKFIMKDIGVTPRVFNHWIAVGLVTNKFKVGDYRFKFSFVELIWFNIVKELRNFGFPINGIKEVYKNMMEPVHLFETLVSIDDKGKEKIIKNIESRHDIDEVEKQEILSFMREVFAGPVKANNGTFDLVVTPLHLLLLEFLETRSDLRLLIDSNGNTIPYNRNVFENISYEEMMEGTDFDSQSYI